MKKLKKFICFSLVLATGLISPAFSQEKQDEKIVKATTVIKGFTDMKESIPAELMQRAEGIIIIPGLINAGFGIGGKRGKGLAMVKNEDGSWSNPAFVTLTGGSIGFQAGVQSIDLVMVFMNKSTLMNIGQGDFTLGGDISIAAGPVGRSSSANTDSKLEAEVYSYSRSKGLFAGISLNGAQLDIDKAANMEYYKKETTASAIFESSDNVDSNVKSLKSAIKAIY
ncbi:lipid-binding SYLF domain-containing protein [Daejeonella oryzae]|uniref:lipid-binding SYLF domain-containing protein n=1 Tax=Daejeonella oryzae TaxID=1122943 RepID=UPI0003F70C7A|nr:lipid-binding SYLF domain-containing protein [Daejeonella oryzae]